MENLLFSINNVFPIFIVMLTGFFFREIGLLDDMIVSKLNLIVFHAALPALVFMDIISADLVDAFDFEFTMFVVLGIIASFCLIWFFSGVFIKDKSVVGSFVQGSFRGNYALLGLPLIKSVIDNDSTAKASFVAAFIVVAYNELSVLILTLRPSSVSNNLNESNGSNVPSVSNVPNVPNMPKGSNVPSVSNIPSVSNVPNVPNIPSVSNVPNMPNGSNVPNMPNVPNVSNMPNVPNVPNVSAKDTGTPKKAGIKKACLNIFTNPLIIAISISVLFSVFHIKLPTILTRALGYFSNLASPLALLAIGASLTLAKIKKSLFYATVASTIKLIILPAIATAAAYATGFRNDDLMMIFLIFALPSAISSFTMAHTMGGDTDLAASILVQSSLLSAITLTIGIYILKSIGVA